MGLPYCWPCSMALLSYGILARRRGHIAPRPLCHAGIAIVFLTIAIPVQLDGGPWLGVAWAAEGAVLIWLSFILRMRQLRWFGLAAFDHHARLVAAGPCLRPVGRMSCSTATRIPTDLS